MFLGWCCPMTILFFPRSGLKSPTRCVVFVPSSYKHLQATIGSYCHAGRNTDLVPYQRQILRILLVADFLRSVLQRGSYQLHAEYDTLNLRQRAKQEKKMRKKKSTGMMMECGNLAALCNTGQVHLTCFSLCTFRSRGVCVRCAVQTERRLYSWCGTFEFRQCLSGFDSTSFLGNLLVNDWSEILGILLGIPGILLGIPQGVFFWSVEIIWWRGDQNSKIPKDGWQSTGGWTDDFLDVDVPRVIWNHLILATPCWLFSWQRCVHIMDVIRTNQRTHELPRSLYFGFSQVYPK